MEVKLITENGGSNECKSSFIFKTNFIRVLFVCLDYLWVCLVSFGVGV